MITIMTEEIRLNRTRLIELGIAISLLLLFAALLMTISPAFPQEEEESDSEESSEEEEVDEEEQESIEESAESFSTDSDDDDGSEYTDGSEMDKDDPQFEYDNEDTIKATDGRNEVKTEEEEQVVDTIVKNDEINHRFNSPIITCENSDKKCMKKLNNYKDSIEEGKKKAYKDTCKDSGGEWKKNKCSLKKEEDKVAFDHVMEEKGLWDSYVKSND